ncbi:MAG: ATP-grasp domain-containing protein [Acidobacteria bacterium]|nr:ATP-grasp domain-containing protein [Acidobacteriota bacterium]
MRTNWLLSTIGKRGYIADYLREADPELHVVGSGNVMFTPGFTSCDEAVLMPEIADLGYLDAVREVVASRKIDAILSLSDPDVAALSQLRTELSAQGVSCFFPDAETARVGFDKLETARWAAANGVRVPRTFADAGEAMATVGLPLIRKPRYGSGSAGVAVIRDESELLPGRHDSTEYLYQELIVGQEVNLELCSDLAGRPMGVSCWKKLISRNGETELAVTLRRQDLLDLGFSLAEKLAIVGPCDVDVIDRDGELFLIEFNMRFGGGYPVSQLAGAGFPELLVRAQKGEKPALRTDFEGDVFMMKTLRPFGGRMAEAAAMFLLEGGR